jgi:FkbM family methyltransferase
MRTTRELAVRALRRIVIPLAPAGKKLPLKYAFDSIEGACENELRHLHRLVRERDTAIDVGANEGMFAYKMSSLFSKVYAFELNASITKNLADFGAKNVQIIHHGLSSRAAEATLYIPVSHGVPLNGWASLAPGNCPGVTEHISKRVELCVLDSLVIRPVSFMKIDVEGHELEVLKGARETIVTCRPVVLIEIKLANRALVAEFFAPLDYVQKRLYEAIGVHGSEENFVFFPSEKF